MVELCELNLMNCGDDYWPADMDQHVANLDFGENSMSMAQSAFVSMMADQGLNGLSTDSLDMANLHARCQNNKNNDYKLTFEDSGQWTTSGIGQSFTTTNTSISPPTSAPKRVLKNPETLNDNFSLRLLEELNERDSREHDFILNNTHMQNQTENLTTWQRISNNEKSHSRRQFTHGTSHNNNIYLFEQQQPATGELNTSNKSNSPVVSRPPSLIANFVGQGRCVDVNSNEIGFVPVSTQPFQSAHSSSIDQIPTSSQRTFNSSTSNKTMPLCSRHGEKSYKNLPTSGTVPDLKFINLSHKVPTICQPSISLDGLMRKMKVSNDSLTEVAESCIEESIIIDDNDVLYKTYNETEISVEKTDPDSGFGTSNNSSGPLHIDDWSSLAILLPRHVVDAFSFFKNNTSLLTGSSNNIERASLDGFAGRRNGINSYAIRPSCSQEKIYLNRSPITTSEILTRELNPRDDMPKLRLHLQELNLVGFPFYERKRTLVEKVVEGVAEIARGASSIVLLSALERLLQDGLLDNFETWDVIKRVTTQGPLTNDICQLIQEIEANKKPLNSCTSHFFRCLMSIHSLDGWFNYLVLKENVLKNFYDEDAFLPKAHNIYRSLFWRLIEALELLTVISLSNSAKKEQRKRSNWWTTNSESASKTSNALKIPKSSSVPSRFASSKIRESHHYENEGKLHENDIARTKEKFEEHYRSSPTDTTNAKLEQRAPTIRNMSKIPVNPETRRSLSRRRTRSRSILTESSESSQVHTHCIDQRAFLIGKAKVQIGKDLSEGLLPLERGELVKILGMRERKYFCRRLRYRHGVQMHGKVPINVLHLLA